MRSFLLSLIFSSALFLSVSANAQNLMVGYSETEKVGFAFYHLINLDPPVEDWVMNRDDYKKARPDTRLEILDQDRIRLREGYANYFEGRDLITVKLTMYFDASDNPDYPADPQALKKGLAKRVQIKYPPGKGLPYFPFEVGKLAIGVIPKDSETVFRQDMTLEQFDAFCASAGKTPGDFRDVAIPTVIVMRPVKADARRPIMDSDTPVWLMMAEVGAIYLRNNDKDIDWSYAASWYDQKQKGELMTLLGNRL